MILSSGLEKDAMELVPEQLMYFIDLFLIYVNGFHDFVTCIGKRCHGVST
jgi:hypothetical protein